LQTPKGCDLLAEELTQVQRALDSLFGDQFLQIGHWGGDLFLPFARTRRSALLCEWPEDHASLVADPRQLPISSDSIDVVLLPHVLETNVDPHSVLREVDRVLRPDGHVVVLGVNPISLWGLRHGLSRGHFPAGVRHLISEHRLTDWLRLLNFTVQDASFYFFQAPILGRPAFPPGQKPPDEGQTVLSDFFWRCRELGRKLMPLAGFYVVVARKEVYTMTPVRPAWRRRRRMVGGLVNPTTRNAA